MALLTFTAIGSTGWVVTSQLLDLSAKLPTYKGNLISKIRDLRGTTRGQIEEASETIREIGEELAGDNSESSDEATSRDNLNAGERGVLARLLGESLNSARKGSKDNAVAVKVVALPPSPLEQVQAWLGPLVVPLTTSGVVVVLTLFMSMRREDMRNRIIQLIGAAHLRTTTEALDEATKRIMDLIRMQLVVNAIYGVAVGTGLYLIGVPNAFLWGVLGLLLRFLPYVGPWFVAAMPITLSLAVFDDWSHALMTIGMFMVLEILVNNVLEPWLYGASAGVSSVGIIVAAIFWTWLWGPIGLVIAMPLTVCLVVAGNYVPQVRFLTILLGDGSTLTVEEQFYQRLLALDDEEADQLVSDYLKRESREQFYDDVLIPALCMVERDRHAGVLKAEQETALLETTRELVEELGSDVGSALAEPAHETRDSNVARDARSAIRVLCVPGHDKADEITAVMLSQLLSDGTIEAETSSTDVLAAELVEYVKTTDVNAVVISAVPPRASRHARYLCKRLRAQLPELPIIVGLWSGSHLARTLKRLEGSGATAIVHSLADAVKKLQALRRLDNRSHRLDKAKESDPHSKPNAETPSSCT